METFYPLNCTLLNFVNVSLLEKYVNCTYGDGIYDRDPASSPISPLVHMCLQIFYGVIFVGGVAGNALVIHVVTHYSKVQTVTNFYILNLAMADILYLMGLPFLIVTSELKNWIFGNYVCKFYMVITSLNQFTSSFFLSIMSADRYIAVCHPIRAQKYRTAFISKVMSLTAWSAASVMIVPVFMYSTTFQVEDKTHCNIYWSRLSFVDGQTLFTLYTLFLSFVLPFFLIFFSYGLVINKLQKTKTKSKSVERKKSQRKVARLVLALIIVYFLCSLPYWTLQISLFFVPPMTAHSSFVLFLFLFSSCLLYSNSAVNPVLYAFLSDNFKKSFRMACLCSPKLTYFIPSKINRNSKKQKGEPSQKHATSTKCLLTATDEKKANKGEPTEKQVVQDVLSQKNTDFILATKCVSPKLLQNINRPTTLNSDSENRNVAPENFEE